MKCPMCDGSGKCYEQKIRYQEIETNRTDFTLAKCHKCNGTGEVQMTNEEWFNGLSTEEKAEILFQEYCNGRNDATTGDWEGVDTYVEWLKQPHGEVVNHDLSDVQRWKNTLEKSAGQGLLRSGSWLV